MFHNFMPSSSSAIIFNVSVSIVDTINDKMFFHPDDNQEDGGPAITKVKALQLLKKWPGESYQVEIKNPIWFELSVDFTSNGLSFHQTTASIRNVQNYMKAVQLIGLNDHIVNRFVRVLVRANMQTISDLLNHRMTWAFSLAFDGITHLGISFFDIRARIPIKGDILNLHLVDFPHFERHTAVNTTAPIVNMCENLCGTW